MKKGILLSLLALVVIGVAVLLLLPVGYFDQSNAEPPPDAAAAPGASDAATGPAIGISGAADPTAPITPVDPNAALQTGQTPGQPAVTGVANPELVERAIQQAERELHSAPNAASDAPIPCDNDLSATSDCR